MLHFCKSCRQAVAQCSRGSCAVLQPPARAPGDPAKPEELLRNSTALNPPHMFLHKLEKRSAHYRYPANPAKRQKPEKEGRRSEAHGLMLQDGLAEMFAPALHKTQQKTTIHRFLLLYSNAARPPKDIFLMFSCVSTNHHRQSEVLGWFASLSVRSLSSCIPTSGTVEPLSFFFTFGAMLLCTWRVISNACGGCCFQVEERLAVLSCNEEGACPSCQWNLKKMNRRIFFMALSRMRLNSHGWLQVGCRRC